MDILAKKRVLPVLITTGICLWTSAANAGMYGLSRVDYFNREALGRENEAVRAPRAFSSDDLWAVKTQDAAGRFFLKRPPEAVVDLLQDPNRSTGLNYLAWNKARLEKLEQAAAVLDGLSRTSLPAKAQAAP